MVDWLEGFWDAVWPNLAASVIWIPATFIHITRSNRKHLRLYLGDKPGRDKETND